MGVEIDISKSGHYVGDCRDLLKRLPDGCIDSIVTSPPYWGQRQYIAPGQIGLEETHLDYVEAIVEVFTEAYRVLRPGGTLFLNLGDAYAGSWGAQSRPDGNDTGSTIEGSSMLSSRQIATSPKRAGTGSKKRTPNIREKNLLGLPWQCAFALRDRVGFDLRNDVVWHKPNAFPAPVKDRFTCAHEYLFFFAKGHSYDFRQQVEPAISARPSGNGFKRPERIVMHDGKGEAKGSDKPWRDVGGTRNVRSVWESDSTADDLLAKHIEVALATGDGQLALILLRELQDRWSDVWTIATHGSGMGHCAEMTEEVAERCVLAGTPEGGVVLDMFFGSGTTGVVAERHGRRWIGFDLGYEDLAKQRTAQRTLPLAPPLPPPRHE